MRRLCIALTLLALAACSPPRPPEAPAANANTAPAPVDPTQQVPYDLQAVDFVNLSHGWIVGADEGNNVSVILRTSDGGANWYVTTELVGDTLLDVDFADETTGWVVGTEGTVYASTDAGKTWAPEPPSAWTARYAHAPAALAGHAGEDTAPTMNESIASIFFADAKTGWAAGDAPTGHGVDVRGLVLGTTDGGRTWSELKDASGSGAPFSVNDVWFTSATDGWAAGGSREDNQEDVLMHTTDGGRTWARVPTNSAEYLRAVQFVDKDHGWVVGLTVDAVDNESLGPSKILATSDGGQTWTSQFTSPRSFYDVYFASDRRGWAVGDRASIYATTDGGKTWRQQARFVTTGSRRIDAAPKKSDAGAPALRTLLVRGPGEAWAGGDGVVLKRK